MFIVGKFVTAEMMRLDIGASAGQHNPINGSKVVFKVTFAETGWDKGGNNVRKMQHRLDIASPHRVQ